MGGCEKLHVFKAYRSICDQCSQEGKDGKRKLCTSCGVDVRTLTNANGQLGKYAETRDESVVDEKRYEEEVDECEAAFD